MNPPYQMTSAICSRLKIMANLDISERRLPQDGRIRALVNNHKIDLRMSTLPPRSGRRSSCEFSTTRRSTSRSKRSLRRKMLELWKEQIDQPHGIVLVTGPTGSGKTTTLYSSLRVMDGNKLNISTVEDPIEYSCSRPTRCRCTRRSA